MSEQERKPAEIVKCPGCDQKVVWTGIYGPWCRVCYPRNIDVAPRRRGGRRLVP